MSGLSRTAVPHPFARRLPLATRLALIAALLPVVAAAQGLDRADLEAARALRDSALRSPLAYELVTSLTTEVGQRAAGTPGDLAGVNWAVRKLRELGFANVRTMDVTVPRWIRGEASLEIVEPFPQSLPAVALGGSIGTPDEGLQAEVVHVQNLQELDALSRERVEGRIVFFSQRTERTRDASGYGRAVRVRVAGASAAAAKGAVAVVIRSISTSNNRLPHTGAMSYSISSPRIPAVAISNPDADQLERILASGRSVRMAMRVTSRDLPQTRSANVIAEVPGTGLPEEIVLLGAHLDSWDLGTGALDDAAGVAIVTAAAHLLRQTNPRPRRTIRVVLYANEEFGLSGANTYAEVLRDEISRHAVAMEADLGAGPVWQLSSRVAETSLPLVQQIHSIVAPLGVARVDNDADGGADISPLRRAGVPIIAPELDASLYFDHHHSANDTLDKVNPEHLAQSVAVYAVSAYLAARASGRWPHLVTSESTQ